MIGQDNNSWLLNISLCVQQNKVGKFVFTIIRNNCSSVSGCWNTHTLQILCCCCWPIYRKISKIKNWKSNLGHCRFEFLGERIIFNYIYVYCMTCIWSNVTNKLFWCRVSMMWFHPNQELWRTYINWVFFIFLSRKFLYQCTYKSTQKFPYYWGCLYFLIFSAKIRTYSFSSISGTPVYALLLA